MRASRISFAATRPVPPRTSESPSQECARRPGQADAWSDPHTWGDAQRWGGLRWES